MSEYVSPLQPFFDKDLFTKTAHMLKDTLLRIQKFEATPPGAWDFDLGGSFDFSYNCEALLEIRNTALTGNWIYPLRKRKGDWEFRFIDYLSPYDEYNWCIRHVLLDYTKDRRGNDLDPIVLDTPEVRQIVADIEKWLAMNTERDRREREHRELMQKRQLAAIPNLRQMPHAPDHGSLVAAAAAFVNDPQADAQNQAAYSQRKDGAWFEQSANLWLIRGLVDYYLGHEVRLVQGNLHEATRRFATAVTFGVRPHAWAMEQWLMTAIAVGNRTAVDALIALRLDDWDTARIRPVNWLVTRIRLAMDLWRKDDSELSRLLEFSRLGVFVDKLPPELDPDLPLMRNWHHALAATVNRKGDDLTTCLRQRMDLRTEHFRRGGTSSPIALIDLDALALIRLARQRGLDPQVEHVYLPLELIAEPLA